MAPCQIYSYYISSVFDSISCDIWPCQIYSCYTSSVFDSISCGKATGGVSTFRALYLLHLMRSDAYTSIRTDCLPPIIQNLFLQLESKAHVILLDANFAYEFPWVALILFCRWRALWRGCKTTATEFRWGPSRASCPRYPASLRVSMYYAYHFLRQSNWSTRSTRGTRCTRSTMESESIRWDSDTRRVAEHFREGLKIAGADIKGGQQNK